jgi:FkbM family methyltransferase
MFAGAMEDLRESQGWWWPKGSEYCEEVLLRDVRDADARWTGFCKHKRVVVQAGGNAGVYPKMLARHFRTVYTFEPEPANFKCLKHNVNESNVVRFNAALSDKAGSCGLHIVPENTGAHWMEGSGDTPVATIDGLNLGACDLIALDIEGAELLALKGAENTIRQYRPTLIIEDKRHEHRFGLHRDDTTKWMRDMGYVEISRVGLDKVWVAA